MMSDIGYCLRVCLCMCLGILALSAAATAQSDTSEHVVWGEVTAVEPLTEPVTHHADPNCAGPKPNTKSLTDLLAWDLHPDCQIQIRQEVVGYRVEYQWDGRRYTMQQDQHPGDRVPLRLRLR